jgi:hypothetical protein
MAEGIVALRGIAGAVVAPDVLGWPLEPRQPMMVICAASCAGHEPRFWLLSAYSKLQLIVETWRWKELKLIVDTKRCFMVSRFDRAVW